MELDGLVAHLIAKHVTSHFDSQNKSMKTNNEQTTSEYKIYRSTLTEEKEFIFSGPCSQCLDSHKISSFILELASRALCANLFDSCTVLRCSIDVADLPAFFACLCDISNHQTWAAPVLTVCDCRWSSSSFKKSQPRKEKLWTDTVSVRFSSQNREKPVAPFPFKLLSLVSSSHELSWLLDCKCKTGEPS